MGWKEMVTFTNALVFFVCFPFMNACARVASSVALRRATPRNFTALSAAQRPTEPPAPRASAAQPTSPAQPSPAPAQPPPTPQPQTRDPRPSDQPIVDQKSIAVLPFENMSDDKENTAFFADGMHEDILTNLANIRDLRVISRTSVMNYRGTKKKIPEIARELGVTYILEGSVRRAGSTVRITGQLIRAANDEHLWAKSYDRELTPKEVFSIQAALATEIAGALQAVISPETKKILDRLPTETLAAYDLYLKPRKSLRAKQAGTAAAGRRRTGSDVRRGVGRTCRQSRFRVPGSGTHARAPGHGRRRPRPRRPFGAR